MTEHNVVLTKRIGIESTPKMKKRSIRAFDVWEAEIDGVKMEVLLTRRLHPGNPDSKRVLRFSNKLLKKHPDYKQIREKVLEQISKVYREGFLILPLGTVTVMV